MSDSDRETRRGLASALLRRGCRDEAIRLCRPDVFDGGDDLDWLHDMVSWAMDDPNLAFAGECAAVLAALRWGSRWHPPHGDGTAVDPPRPPVVELSAPKLRHDIDQFRYLQDRGILGNEFTPIIAHYERVIDRLATLGPRARAEQIGRAHV